MKNIKEIQFNPDSILLWDVFFKGNPEKERQYKLLLSVFIKYLFTDVELGAKNKFDSVNRFFKSEQFEKIGLTIDSEEDLVCLGMAIQLVIRYVEDQLIMRSARPPQMNENKKVN